MSGLLNKAAAWLPKALGRAAAIPGGVTLARGAAARTGVPAVRAWHTNEPLTGPDGLVTTVRPYDYLIAATEYRFASGAPVEPAPGDQITEPLGTFEVLPVPKQPCFRLREDGLYRVHTKRIAA